MSNTIRQWEPTSPDAWASVLGLVKVPLFGQSPIEQPPGSHAVLLDGQEASFAISAMEHAELGDGPLSWSWSANLNHLLTIDRTRGEMFLRRWDDPHQLRRFRLPARAQGAMDLLKTIEAAPPLRAADVIIYLLRAFRQIRQILDNPLDAIRVLNAFLIGTEKVQQNLVSEADWLNCRTVEDLVSRLPDPRIAGVSDMAASVRKREVGVLPSLFLTPDPITGCRLVPELLLRHAASQLYQEAHLSIERDSQLVLFPGMATAKIPTGESPRDVRFTPPSLARTLVQQALNNFDRLSSRRKPLEILDPACGSGVFLQEALHEVVARGFRGAVSIRGCDISEISCAIAEFCLQYVKTDVEREGVSVSIDIRRGDALEEEWGSPDVILMNPPFASWTTMKSVEQSRIREILGPLSAYRMDKAMAFIWKATQSLKAGAALSAVLPAPLLETESGSKWRNALLDSACLCLVGRFEMAHYFRGATVEPGFVVLRKRANTAAAAAGSEPIQVVLAKAGEENEALRALRLDPKGTNPPAEPQRWEVFQATSTDILTTSWYPRSRIYSEFISRLQEQAFPKVGELFDVKQGVRSGDNKAFVISSADYNSLPKKERRHFRPVASNSTIHSGRILRSQHLFYPYDRNGITLLTNEHLKQHIPIFLKTHLAPARERLAKRQRVGDQWWQLAEPRSWQRERASKLVSTYFGHQGSFAYDDVGATVVHQGHAWIWRREPIVKESTVGDEAPSLSFHETELPWAYLALLNSPVFELALGAFCPRVQGGQLNLSARFVKKVFIPDLSDETRICSDIIRSLAEAGRHIHRGKLLDVTVELVELGARAYGVSPEVLPAWTQ